MYNYYIHDTSVFSGDPLCARPGSGPIADGGTATAPQSSQSAASATPTAPSKQPPSCVGLPVSGVGDDTVARPPSSEVNTTGHHHHGQQSSSAAAAVPPGVSSSGEVNAKRNERHLMCRP